MSFIGRHAMRVAFAAVVLLASVGQHQAQSAEDPYGGVSKDVIEEGRDCGAYSFGVLLELLGLVCGPLDALRRETATDESGACSLGDLARALSRRGVPTQVLPPGGTPPDAPSVVALVRRADDEIVHFAVVRALDDRRVLLYEPPLFVSLADWNAVVPQIRGPILRCDTPPDHATNTLVGWASVAAAASIVLWSIVKRRGSLRSAATVLALAVTCAACGTGASEGPLAVHPGPFLDLGSRPPGTASVDLALENVTDEPIRLVRVTASCACASLEMVVDTPLRRREKRAVRAKITVRPGQREFVNITFQPGQGPAAHATVALAGETVEGVTHSQQISLGRVPVGAPSRARVSIGIESRAARRLRITGRPVWILTTGRHRARLLDTQPEHVEATQGEIVLRGDVEVLPLQPGPGSVDVLVAVGWQSWTTTVTWDAVYPRQLEPAAVVVRPENGMRGSTHLRTEPGERVRAVTCTLRGLRWISIGRGENRWEIVGVVDSGARLSTPTAGDVTVVLQRAGVTTCELTFPVAVVSGGPP